MFKKFPDECKNKLLFYDQDGDSHSVTEIYEDFYGNICLKDSEFEHSMSEVEIYNGLKKYAGNKHVNLHDCQDVLDMEIKNCFYLDYSILCMDVEYDDDDD